MEDSSHVYSVKSFIIMAFSVENENHYAMILPPNIETENVEMKLELLGGCLCLVCADNYDVNNIWVMMEYGVEESWTQLLSVGPPGILPFYKSSVCLKPLAYSKNGEKVLLNCGGKKLAWYGLIRKTVWFLTISDLPYNFVPETCVESLVRPDCPGEGDGVTTREKEGKEDQEEGKFF
ncbi:Hypothetical predicted protein [Olea europaea subsp. europaea]|uniref:F-box protein n=1 Tax=Olea europaea subsp. europaea TaxID=158383 RepID=A0A8S0RLM1_OLEEU|nr:Hypothetical predicted protein [Olea europaea subsp. europaea]